MRKKFTQVLMTIVILLLLSGVSFAQEPFEVLFTCDMSVQKLSGFFDPATDTLDVRGSFNGWAGPNDILNVDPFYPDLYSILIDMDLVPITDTVAYKYVITKGADTHWESVDPANAWNGNRWFHTTGNEPDLNGNGRKEVMLDTVYWGDTGPDDIFLVETDVIFQVHMGPAYAYLVANDSITYGGQTVTAIDHVHLASGHTLTDPEMLWVWDFPGDPRVDSLELNDAGVDGDITAGDSVFTLTVSFLVGSAKNVTWKHGIDAADNEGGFAMNHNEDVSGGSTYKEFGSQDTLYSSVWIYTGMDDDKKDFTPLSYELRQNYPNPFNPNTTIEYALNKNSQVNLEVYNMLGQKVRSLVNGQVSVGDYKVVWNGKNDHGEFLSSGVYFYKLSIGNFSGVRKMILMK